MARTPSNMLPLGTKAPEFTLLDVVSNQQIAIGNSTTSKATLIMFICNHCPFVKHINEQLAALGNDYINQGVTILAINSNDVTNYPADAPHLMIETAESEGYIFPYLYDESQQVAKAYQAACTPDFFLFDTNLKLAYRGQLDDARPGNNIPVTGNSMREALDMLLAGKSVDVVQKPSIGCNIKWK